MAVKILTTFHAEHYPENYLFMMDSDDERMGVDYFPVAVDCWYRPEFRQLHTEYGIFAVDPASWECTQIRFKRPVNSL